MPTQIADIIQPKQFSDYIAENSLFSTAFFLSGVLVKKDLMQAQLAKGPNNFVIPF
jgi:hypothetical protein